MSGGRVYGETFGRVPDWLLDSDVSDRAIRLYALLTRYADSDHKAFPGRKKLAERMRGCSVDTVDRAMAELVAVEAVRVMARWTPGGSRSTNDYYLLPSPQICGYQAADSRPPGRTVAAPRPQIRGGIENRKPVNESQITKPSSSSCHSRATEPANGDDDDWALLIAKRRLTERPAHLDAVPLPRLWLTRTAEQARAEMGDEAASFLADHPNATPAEIADHLCPGQHSMADVITRTMERLAHDAG